MRLAILGTRGIPPAYGGFETMAWELSQELASRGHDITVYSYRGRTDESRRLLPGTKRRFVPGVGGKYLETVTHTAMGALDTVLHPYEGVLLVNAANALVAFLPRLRGAKVAINVDGIERQRSKWGRAGRIWYTVGERLSLLFPNVIVSDAQVVSDYYQERYGRDTCLITYGATLLDREPAPDLEAYGLSGIEPGRFLLYVSRLEPENQADLVIRAYANVASDVPLLIVGDAPHATEYRSELERLVAADPRVRLTGGLYGSAYSDMQRSAMAYVQATSVGGTHPALIESMAAGNLVLAFGSPENREVTAGSTLIFDDQEELTRALATVVAAPTSAEHERLRSAARAHAEATYSWPAIADAYETMFEDLIAGRV